MPGKVTPIKQPPVYDPSDVDSQDAERIVVLGTHTYHLHEVPLARVKRFRNVWTETFATLNTSVNAGIDDADTVNTLIDYVLSKPEEILQIVIPDLDLDAFNDEDTGATMPQIMHALDRAITINGCDFMRAAVPFFLGVAKYAIIQMVQTMGAFSTKTPSSVS